MQAALHVLGRSGAGGLFMVAVARAARVGVGTLYIYFSSKDDLVRSALAHGVDRLRPALQTLAEPGVPSLERIEAFLHTTVDEVVADPLVAGAIIRSAWDWRRRSSEPVLRHRQEVLRALEAVLADGVKKGEVGPCQTRAVATAIVGALDGVIAQALRDGRGGVDVPLLRAAPGEIARLFLAPLRPQVAGGRS